MRGGRGARWIAAVGALIGAFALPHGAPAQTVIAKTHPAAGSETAAPKATSGAMRDAEERAIVSAGSSDFAKQHGQGTEPAETGAIETAAIPAAVGAIATTVTLSGDRIRTRLAFTISAPANFQVFTLADPYRVIVDAENLTFQLPTHAGLEARGLIRAFRYGSFAPGKSRVVIDVTGPVQVLRAEVTRGRPDQPLQLVIEIAATDRIGMLASQPITPHRVPPPLPVDVVGPRVSGAGAKPVIVIDPGHGGLDPGAISPGAVMEKDVVLAVARHLHRALAASGRYDVRMTRSSDVFVALDQRVAISRVAGASLFISVHADSVGGGHLAQAVRGATVYTLSEQASSREAQVLADKENSADTLAGIDSTHGDTDDLVKDILFDLMKRETQNFANDFKSVLVEDLRHAVTLAKEPARSAAFKVLRQPQAPAVLVELGFVTNAEDAKLLQSTAWQQRVAGAVAGAVDKYFAKRVATNR